jgi:hypothetical protein
MKKLFLIIFIPVVLSHISCTSPEKLYNQEFKRASNYFGVKAEKPSLIWISEDAYHRLVDDYPNLEGTIACYVAYSERQRPVIWAREIYKGDPRLQHIFAHELGHHFFNRMKKKEHSEWFAKIYSEMLYR